MTPNLSTFLKECRDIEAKATPKEWKSDFDGDVFTTAQKEYCPGMEQELFRTLGTTKCGPDRGDAEFIAFSRNNFLKLVQAVEILSEACEYYEKHTWLVTRDVRVDPPSDKNTFGHEMGFKANEALSRVEEILGNG